MSEREEDYGSDAPEEFTNEQGIKQDEQIRKIQKENKARIVHEGKERRRLWAQRKTPRQSARVENGQEDQETETDEDSQIKKGMLPTNIVEMLASREKQVFLSDSEDEKTEVKPTSRKKKKILRVRICNFEGHTTSSMLTEFLGVLEEKENASSKVNFSFKELQPSTSPKSCSFYFGVTQKL